MPGLVDVVVEDIDKVVFEELAVCIPAVLSHIFEANAPGLQLISPDVCLALLRGVERGPVNEHLRSGQSERMMGEERSLAVHSLGREHCKSKAQLRLVLLLVYYIHELLSHFIAERIHDDDSLLVGRRGDVVIVEILLTADSRETPERAPAAIQALNPLKIQVVGELCVILVKKQFRLVQSIGDAIGVYLEVILKR